MVRGVSTLPRKQEEQDEVGELDQEQIIKGLAGRGATAGGPLNGLGSGRAWGEHVGHEQFVFRRVHYGFRVEQRKSE